MEATSANVHDVTKTSKLLTGEEEVVYGDSGYLGAGKHDDAIIRNKAGRKIKYRINRRPSQVKKLSKSGQYAAKKAEHAKSSVRAKVEHVFGVVKKQLRFRKTRYRGLEKQQDKFNIVFALANLNLADSPCLAARVSAPLRAKIQKLSTVFIWHLLYNADFGIYAVMPSLSAPTA